MDINKRKIRWTNSDTDKFWKEMWRIADMVKRDEDRNFKRNTRILNKLKVTLGGKSV